MGTDGHPECCSVIELLLYIPYMVSKLKFFLLQKMETIIPEL